MASNGPLTLDQIDALPPLEYRIDPILERRGMLILSGDPKKGKSRLVLQWTLDALTGRPACGRFAQHYRRPLIYNAEGGVYGLRARQRMWAPVPREARPQLLGWSARPILTDNDGHVKPSAKAALVGKWQELGVDLVVFDPFVSFHSADENNNERMHAIVDLLRNCAELADVSIIVVHHTKKPSLDDSGERSGMRMRGATAIYAGFDNVVMAWPYRSPTGVGGFKLTFESKHSLTPDEVMLVDDRLLGEQLASGRFYRAVELLQRRDGKDVKLHVGAPEDFVADWGADVARYAQAFGLRQAEAEALLGALKEAV